MPMTMAFLALRGTSTSQNYGVLLQLIREFAGRSSRAGKFCRDDELGVCTNAEDQTPGT